MRNSSLTNLYPRCFISALQSGQNRSSFGTSQCTSCIGSDSYKSARTDFFLRVRVCSFTEDTWLFSSSFGLFSFVFSLFLPKIFLLNSSKVSVKFAIVARRSVMVALKSVTVSLRSAIVASFSFKRCSSSIFVFCKSCIISSIFTDMAVSNPLFLALIIKETSISDKT